MRKFVMMAAAMVLVASGCDYYNAAVDARNAGDPVPWWCAPTEEIPVTDGPASGNVDWYAGTHKAPLSYAECEALSVHFDNAKAYAEQWPTRGLAEAEGWREMTGYIPGMGTHHVRGGITPQMLNSSSFDRLDPILDSVGLDAAFDAAKPEVLQFDGSGADAKLVGFDYYVRTTTGQPPAGFAGNNDWWHHHPWICHRKTDAAMVGFNITDADCTARGGINVNMANYYMLHVWIIDDMTFEPDVYAGMIPCITGGSAIHDPDHSCHTSRSATTSAKHTMEADTPAVDHATMDHG